MLSNGLTIYAAYLAGMLVIYSVTDTQRAGHDEISGGHTNVCTGHGCVGKTHGKQGLDFDTHTAGRLLHASQCRAVRNAQPVGIDQLYLACLKPTLDLRSCPVHQDQPDSKAVQQCNIMDQVAELRVGYGLAPEGEHEGASPVCMDIGCRVAEALDKLPV